MIYNTEMFEVSDAAKFKDAIDSLRAALTDAGGTEIKVFRHVVQPNRVMASMWWPDAESCRAFGRDHEEEFETRLVPLVTSMQPEDLWQEL